MAVEVLIKSEDNYFCVRVSGATDVEEVSKAYAGVFELPEYKQNMNCLWDTCGLKLSQFSMGEVRELTRVLRQYSAQRGADYKVAFATANKGDFQLLRVYATFFRLVGSFRMQVFNDPELAEQWLKQED